MPSIASALGLIIVVVGSTSAAAQPQASPSSSSTPSGTNGVTQAWFQSPVSPGDSPSPGETSPQQPKSTTAIPLPAPVRESSSLPGQAADARAADPNKHSYGLPSIVTLGGSLALVLGLFMLLTWGVRRATPSAWAPLPSTVVEILGRAPLAGRQQMHLLRCGKKLLLVSVTPVGAETLTEITDPIEVDRLAGLCHQSRPNSATAAFRQVFQQFAPQHPTRDALGQADYDGSRPARAGLRGRDGGVENIHV